MARSSHPGTIVTEQQLEMLIRKIVRKVVREEFQRVLKLHPELVEKWMSTPESPLYADMKDIRKEIRSGKTRLLNDREVWGA